MNIGEMSPSRRRRKPDQFDVLAAGGVVWRAIDVGAAGEAAADGIEVVLVHRDRYDDWSFPKGKLEKGESFEDAALREVAEETGLVCERGEEMPSTSYLDSKGRQKLVRYWAMRVVGTAPWMPNHEIDGRRWVTLDEATEMLTYAHDRELVERLRAEFG
jgi:8-oxo-dGTP diphosphatase